MGVFRIDDVDEEFEDDAVSVTDDGLLFNKRSVELNINAKMPLTVYGLG